jgi:hypothetical protein
MTAIDRINNIKWLHAIGKPITSELACLQIKGINEAVEYATSPNWERAMLDAHNDVTRFLSHCHNARFREWNRHVSNIKQQLRHSWNCLRDELRSIGQEQLADLAEWNTLHAALLEQYIDVGPPLFFGDLLVIYEMGHLPCGWLGGWPDGRLVVL